MISFFKTALARIVWASALAVGAAWCVWSLLYLNAASPSLFAAASDVPYPGFVLYASATVRWLLLYVFGLSVLVIPLVLINGVLRALAGPSREPVWDRVLATVMLMAAGAYFAQLAGGIAWHGQLITGGLLGSWLLRMCGSGPLALAGMGWLALVSALIASRCTLIVALIWFERESLYALRFLIRTLRIDRALGALFGGLARACASFAVWVWGLITGAGVAHLVLDPDQQEEMPNLHDIVADASWHEPVPAPTRVAAATVVEPMTDQVWQALPLTLFACAPDTGHDDGQVAEAQARELEKKLAQFSIDGHVAAIKRGPVVTCFEYEPAPDTKLSRIVGLQDDLALALKATSVRIQAPIAGTQYVGFEVARTQRATVPFGHIIASDAYAHHTGPLPLALGVNTAGSPVVADLSRMPHLLVAGSTGSGKSVGLNVMLMSLLARLSPEQLRLILIDPKRLEFGAYADIAHLQFPVVNQPRDAIAVLGWLAHEMEERYKILASAGVRNIADYHARPHADGPTMPYLVTVVDELADLMVLAGRQVEQHLIRIAQMARAAGIHLIVATQRPSVDVITGLIKVNFPSRMAFRVTSKVDSRTIIDDVGAEQLLGHGDMLFQDASSATLMRVHGAYVSDAEIARAVAYIRAHANAERLEIPRAPATEAVDADVDEQLYHEVLTFLGEVDEVSISLLQRRFRIGYNRSARIIEVLEAEGRIVTMDGGKTRKVVRPE